MTNTDRPIVLVGGGTGGHITPLVAVGEELQKRGRNFVCFGSVDGREQTIFQELEWPFYGIWTGKWRRYLSIENIFRNIIDLFKTIIGFGQAFYWLVKLKPKIIFSKGGPVSLPVVYAAWVLSVPIVIHESDTVMGLANRLALPVAKKVLTAFKIQTFPQADRRFLQVGIPIRRSLRQAAKLKVPRKSRPIILVIPGSQGAAPINKLIRAELLNLLKLADLIHVTGEKEFKAHQEIHSRLAPERQRAYKPYAYIDRELPYYFQGADLVISRASATTIAEAALFGKAMYLIPLPHSGSNHQLVNAEILAQEKAVVFDEQGMLSSQKFYEQVKSLLADEPLRNGLGQHLHNYFSKDQATELVVDQLSDESIGV